MAPCVKQRTSDLDYFIVPHLPGEGLQVLTKGAVSPSSFFFFFFLLLPPSANLTVGTKGPGSHRSHSKCQFKWNHLASPAPETYHRLHGSLGTHRAEAYRELRLSLGALPEYLTEMPARVREIFGRKNVRKNARKNGRKYIRIYARKNVRIYARIDVR